MSDRFERIKWIDKYDECTARTNRFYTQYDESKNQYKFRFQHKYF